MQQQVVQKGSKVQRDKHTVLHNDVRNKPESGKNKSTLLKTQGTESGAQEAEEEDLIKNLRKFKDNMLIAIKADRASLVLYIEDQKRNMLKQRDEFTLKLEECMDKEASSKQMIKGLENKIDALSKKNLDEVARLTCQIEAEKRNMEKQREECECAEREQKIFKDKCREQCEELLLRIIEKEQKVDGIIKEVEALKATVKELDKKAENMDPNMKESLKEINRRLKNFGPKWFQKLWKKYKIQKIQELKKESNRLLLEYSKSQAREFISLWVINALVQEKNIMKRHLDSGLSLSFFTSQESNEKKRIKKIMKHHVKTNKQTKENTRELVTSLSTDSKELCTFYPAMQSMKDELKKLKKKNENYKGFYNRW
ncbi:myosin-4-like [Silurus meridionalis]|nr:myosin-4-like [Silurus meridionalis]